MELNRYVSSTSRARAKNIELDKKHPELQENYFVYLELLF